MNGMDNATGQRMPNGGAGSSLERGCVCSPWWGRLSIPTRLDSCHRRAVCLLCSSCAVFGRCLCLLPARVDVAADAVKPGHGRTVGTLRVGELCFDLGAQSTRR